MNRYDYDNSIILQTANGRPYFKSKFYPNFPPLESDVYVITSAEDRLDALAYSYYNDATLWWVISAANNNVNNGALFMYPGTQLRIPTDINNVLQQFDQFNKAR
jgi:hypothetical protein